MPPEPEWTSATLKAHFDELVAAKLGRIEQMMADRDKSLLIALATIEERIVELHASYQRTDEKSRDYYNRDAHDLYASNVAADIKQLQAGLVDNQTLSDQRFLEIIKPKWGMWISGGLLACAILGGISTVVWNVGITPYRDKVDHQILDLESRVAYIKTHQENVESNLHSLTERVDEHVRRTDSFIVKPDGKK